MKKAMVVLAAVAMAACAEAGQFKWQFMADEGAGAGYDGSTVYCVLAADLVGVEIKSAADITGLKISEGTLAFDDVDTYTTGGVTVKGNQYTAGETADWYAFIIDGNKYYQSDAMKSSAIVADNGTPKSTTFSSGSKLADVGNWKSFSGDVPEPTSAMLILLGMAGLALRRRA